MDDTEPTPQMTGAFTVWLDQRTDCSGLTASEKADMETGFHAGWRALAEAMRPLLDQARDEADDLGLLAEANLGESLGQMRASQIYRDLRAIFKDYPVPMGCLADVDQLFTEAYGANTAEREAKS